MLIDSIPIFTFLFVLSINFFYVKIVFFVFKGSITDTKYRKVSFTTVLQTRKVKIFLLCILHIFRKSK